MSEEAPSFRVGVLINQSTRSIAAILNCQRRIFDDAPPSGSLALEAKHNRGEKLVEESSREEILEQYSSVSEAICMRLPDIDPLGRRAARAKDAFAIKDEPSSGTIAGRRPKLS